MDALTRTLHDYIPMIFTILKARNKGRYDVAKHLLFQMQGTTEMLIKSMNAEHRAAIESGEAE